MVNGLLSTELHEVGFDEVVDFAVHDAGDVASLVVGAVVFDAAVVHNVAAYLAAPFNLFLAGLDFGLFFHAVLHLAVVELRAEEAEGDLLVFRLVAGFGVLDEYFFFFASVVVFVLVAEADARFDLVDVLAASAAGTEGVPAEARLVDHDFDGVVDEGCDADGGEGGHALALCVEGAYADKAVDAGFALEVAEGVVAFNLHGDALDASPFAVEAVGDGYAVVVGFGIADVHAHEHLSPVLCFNTTGTGIDGEDGIEAVALSLEHVLEFQGFDEGEGDVDLLDDLLFGGIAAVEELAQDLKVAAAAVDFVESVDPSFLGLDGFHDFLSLFGVAPEVGVFCLDFFLGDLAEKGFDIEVAPQGVAAAENVFDGFGGGHDETKN